MLAVLIDPIFRFSDYGDLLHLLPVAGTMKLSGALKLVFLQGVALFYLILLLPRIPRTETLLLSVYVVVVQFSYRLTLSLFMTGTDLFLALTVGVDTLKEAVISFLNPLIFLYALPYELVLSTLILVPLRSTFRESLALILLPAFALPSGFPSEQFRDPSRADGRTDAFAGSSLRQIGFLFYSPGQQSELLYERLSSWIRRQLRNEDNTYATG